MVFRKLIFVLGHLIFKPKVLPYYFIFKKNENKSLNQINAIKKRKIDDYILKMQSRVSFFKGKQINYENAPITTKSDIKKIKGLLLNSLALIKLNQVKLEAPQVSH
ncbi:hypothetical protein H3302_14305 [Pseudoalteromonas sp. MT33b]|uniref:hypothetical protein n=1 Tax=Pseudoalteromonas sp. MT33b TaxID=2759705 RepID=UPI0015FC3CA1|nr:hypothetical protein [Pseudoalteromonas sp. MT33b]QMW14218.1 hypothetical protein H3302_14305 [Pseudoalteromonas sp. MT33b]